MLKSDRRDEKDTLTSQHIVSLDFMHMSACLISASEAKRALCMIATLHAELTRTCSSHDIGHASVAKCLSEKCVAEFDEMIK